MRKTNRNALIVGLAAFACVSVSTSSASALFWDNWKEKASNAVSSVSNTVSNAVDTVKATASSASSWVQEKAAEAKTFVAEKAAEVVAKAKDVAGKAWNAAKAAANTTINWAKQGIAAAKRGFNAAVAGAKAGVKAVGNGIKAVGNALLSLADVVKKFAAPVLNFVREKYERYSPVVLAAVKKLATAALDKIAGMLTEKYPEAADLIRKVRTGDFLGAVGEAAVLAANKGRPKLINFLSDQAMKVLKPLLVKVNALATKLVLNLVRSPFATAIATAITATVTAAAAAVTAGAGAALAPFLQPLTTMTANSLLQWVIDKVNAKIAEFLFEKTKPLIQTYVVTPAVNKGFDLIHGALVKRFPRVFKGTKLNMED